jgi:hypothetical protein
MLISIDSSKAPALIGIVIGAALFGAGWLAPITHLVAVTLGILAGVACTISVHALWGARHGPRTTAAADRGAPVEPTYPIPGFLLGRASSAQAASERSVRDI